MKGLVFGLLISLATACSPPQGWRPMTTEELIPKYPLILLATLKDAKLRSASLVGGDKTYNVFCVLKGDSRPFPQMVTIPDPMNPCVSIPPDVGQSYILGLDRVNDTAFTWWKEAGLESVIYEYTKENLATFMKFCHLQTPAAPSGQQSASQGNQTCPTVSDSQRDSVCSGTINLTVEYLLLSLSTFFAYNFMKH